MHIYFQPDLFQDFDFTEFITYGDIYPNALDHFCGWVEEVGDKGTQSHAPNICLCQVLVPIFRNESNMLKYPHCVSYDIKKQVGDTISPLLNLHNYHHPKVHELATAVFQIRGLIKGRTLLPFPQVNRAQWKKTLFRIMSLLYYRVSPTSMMRRNESGKVKEKRSPTNVVVLVVDSFNFLILTFNP